MAIVRGRPWDQYNEARRTEDLLLRHPTQNGRLLAIARYHQALALFFQGDVHKIHRGWGWLEDAEDRHDLFLGSWLKGILAEQCLTRGRVEMAALKGNDESALVNLNRGLEHMSVAGSYTLRSTHARRAKGLLIGGAEGEALVTQAEADLRNLGVDDPRRHARAILPGLP